MSAVADTRVPKLREYYASGHSAALECWVNSGGTESVLRRVSAATARLVMEWFVRVGGGYEIVQKIRGSAFSIGHGMFLTAGHGIADCQDILRKAGDVIHVGYAIVTPDGAVHSLDHIHWSGGGTAQDWAVLHVAGAEEAAALELSEFVVLPGRTEMLLVAGYPDGFGINANGEVERPTDDGTPLSPLFYAADAMEMVHEHNRHKAPVVGGTEPVGGLSGGAVVDALGGAVGIQTGVSYRLRDDAVMVDFQTHEVGGLIAYVAERAGRERPAPTGPTTTSGRPTGPARHWPGLGATARYLA